uniref:FAD dependent oxidoreductase domain-containing protein n=1 Tax=Arion vulgaris TaxID=1028688 RepID=A0A0B7A8S7_9EUPU
MTSRLPPKIVVIGAGVNGLACAVCIQKSCPEAQVQVVAETFSPHTTSDGSAGFWRPFVSNQQDAELLLNLCQTTHGYLSDLASSPLAGDVGVQMLSGYQLSADLTESHEDHIVKSVVKGWRTLIPEELARFPMAKSGYFYTSVQVDVTQYLQWLMKKFLENGGSVCSRKVSSLSEFAGQCDLVINCCGLGGKDLLKDDQVTPTRGQVWRVHAPWIKHFYMFKPNPGLQSTYVLPGVSNIVVGGTIEPGNWRTDVNEEDSISIWKRAQELLPQIARATPIRAWAGLRPSRTALRLEPEVLESDGKKLKVIHNYGHGGSGVTLHWGCAIEVTKLALESLDSPTASIQQIKSRL